MVTVAPLYHPLRLLEEICMLDRMSGGRLEVAFGRGALPAEVRFFDVDPAQTEKLHQEALGFILEAFSEGEVTVTAEGGKRRLPLAIPPLQKPHPPLWDGVPSPETDGRAFAGDPEGVAGYVRAQLAESGANYFVGQFAFGNLTLEETLRSIDLFAGEVMTMLERAPARVASA